MGYCSGCPLWGTKTSSTCKGALRFKANIDQGGFCPREDILHPSFLGPCFSIFYDRAPVRYKARRDGGLPEHSPGFPGPTALTIIFLYIFSAPSTTTPHLLHRRWRGLFLSSWAMNRPTRWTCPPVGSCPRRARSSSGLTLPRLPLRTSIAILSPETSACKINGRRFTCFVPDLVVRSTSKDFSGEDRPRRSPASPCPSSRGRRGRSSYNAVSTMAINGGAPRAPPRGATRISAGKTLFSRRTISPRGLARQAPHPSIPPRWWRQGLEPAKVSFGRGGSPGSAPEAAPPARGPAQKSATSPGGR